MRKCDFCGEEYAPDCFEDRGDITVEVTAENINLDNRFDICPECLGGLEDLYTPTPEGLEMWWHRQEMKKMIGKMIKQGTKNRESAELETSKKEG